MLRVALIDPQPAVRAGLAVLLRGEPGLVPVGGAHSAEEGLELLRRRRVDVVVVDPELLGPDGLPYCRRIKALERPPRVVVYTAAAGEAAYAMGAAVAGADAVVIATNHSGFCGREKLRDLAAAAGDDALLVDPWNCFGVQQVFSYTGEAAALAGAGAVTGVTPARAT